MTSAHREEHPSIRIWHARGSGHGLAPMSTSRSGRDIRDLHQGLDIRKYNAAEEETLPGPHMRRDGVHRARPAPVRDTERESYIGGLRSGHVEIRSEFRTTKKCERPDAPRRRRRACMVLT